MVCLYVDEQFPLLVVQMLRDFGHNVLTLNRRHFIKLHLEKPNHYGIIVCSEDRDLNGLAQRINDAITKEKSLANKLIRVKRPQK
ncbi:hypothetical protein H6F92_10855 [Microcystis wesenbergii FACHB-1317]|nr:hypothetical protein [Microcystis wesenbergii FACHB-1317]NCQ90650.1 hypothetical protein [Microcystis aeruginosa LG13-13]NCR04011.1 hypothetical protein [Microcystis aeruginosa LG13-03]NCR62115.1 hypothetical protein [Microcystis aeruginosa LG11-05]